MRVCAIGEDDAIVGAPARAGRESRRLGDVNWHAAVGRNALQATVGEKPDRLAIPREERAGSAVGAGERYRIKPVERSAI
jgi:hypothetical protein